MNNKTKFLKFGIAVLLGAGAAGLLYAQLSIPTDIDNAVITIKQVNVVDNANNAVITLNGSGGTSVTVKGTMVVGDTATNTTSGSHSAVYGGDHNNITGSQSVIAGGRVNKINGSNSMIPGGSDNIVNANYSFAAGRYAKVNTNHNGTFIWSDSQSSLFQSTKANQFLIRAQNGVAINTGNTTTGYDLTVSGSAIIYGNIKTNNMIAGAYYYGSITSEDDQYELKLSQWEGTGNIYYNSGYVGIGTASPTAQLHVNGTTRLQGLSTSTQTTGLVIDANGNVGVRALSTVAFNGVTETDPLVNTLGKTLALNSCTNGQIVKYNGTSWSCQTDAGIITELDPLVRSFAKAVLPTCAAGQVLKGDGTNLSCVTDAGLTSYTETDPLVKPFAKAVLPTCAVGQVLKGDGTNLSCVTDAGLTSYTEIDPLVKPFAKAVLPTCAAGQVLKGDGTNLSCVTDAGLTSYTESDPLVKSFAKAVLPTCAAGQVLKGDGTNLSCVTDNNTVITESTVEGYIANDTNTNYIPYDNGTKLVSSNIYYDGTNVGIGTASPGSKLSFGGYYISSESPSSSQQTSHIRLYDGGAITYGFGVSDSALNIAANQDTGRIRFYTNSLERLRIAANGNVGIGTTSPQSKLHIFAPSPVLTLEGTVDDITKINFIDDGIVAGELSVDRNSGVTKLWTTEPLSFGSANAEKMRILPNGNIGIGTASPGAKLEIAGGSANWNETTPGTTKGTIHLETANTTDNFGNAITWGSSDNTNASHAGIYVRSDGSYGTKMYFATTDAYVAGSKTRMMIDNNGNVGIGTTTPATKLYVNGSIAAQGWIGAGCEGACESGGGYSLLYADGTIVSTVSVTSAAFYYSSDITLKKDLTKITNPLEKIVALNGYNFTWKSNDKKDIGVVAQEVEKVFPEAVKADAKGLKSVEYGNLVAPIIEAIKELYTKYLDQQTQISELEQRIEILEKNIIK